MREANFGCLPEQLLERLSDTPDDDGTWLTLLTPWSVAKPRLARFRSGEKSYR